MMLYRIFAILLCMNLMAQSRQADAEGFGSLNYQGASYRPSQTFQPQHQRLNAQRGFTIELSALGELIGFSNLDTRLTGELARGDTGEDGQLRNLADQLLPDWMEDAIEESSEVLFSSNAQKQVFRPRCKYDSTPAFLLDVYDQAHFQVNLYGNTSTFIVGWLF